MSEDEQQGATGAADGHWSTGHRSSVIGHRSSVTRVIGQSLPLAITTSTVSTQSRVTQPTHPAMSKMTAFFTPKPKVPEPEKGCTWACEAALARIAPYGMSLRNGYAHRDRSGRIDAPLAPLKAHRADTQWLDRCPLLGSRPQALKLFSTCQPLLTRDDAAAGLIHEDMAGNRPLQNVLQDGAKRCSMERMA